jgi:diacylglycerol kinase family enzyme
MRGRHIEADAAPGSVMLELDGEPLGTLPAQIEILPGALAIVGAA